MPATIYLIQVDVVNFYRHALEHYLPLTLNEHFLQNSSLGTPYQKWARFTNDDFEELSFAINNLLTYTGRLIDRTTRVAWRNSRFREESKSRLHIYTSAVCEVSFRNKAVGIMVHEDHRLSITAIRTEPILERLGARSTGERTIHYRLIGNEDGTEREQPIELDEYREITATLVESTVDIRDRSQLAILKQQGLAEVADLEERTRTFAEICNAFYESRRVAEPFGNNSYVPRWK